MVNITMSKLLMKMMELEALFNSVKVSKEG